MGFLAVVNAYSLRVSLNIAITEMVVPGTSSYYDEDSCPSENANKTHNSVTNTAILYDWDETTKGLILSSFFWGYVLTHIPGGVLAEKFGGKYSLGLGILSTAVFTLITPWVIISTNGNWKVLVALRVIMGLGEGTTYPALNALLAKWVPLHERAKIGTLVYAGSQIGTIVSNSISGALINATKNWASVFYVFGAAGVLWFIIWQLICYSEPEGHPFISDEEKAYLKKSLENVSEEKRQIPWREILTSAPLWALVAAQIGHDWGFFTMVTDLPTYMSDVLKFNVKENGIWTSLPYAVMWLVSMGSGWLCDWLVSSGCLGITFARKLFTTIASLGPAIFIMIASYSGCDRYLTVAMFTIAMGFMGPFYCGMKVNALDLAPNYAGTLMAIVNGIGAITGIIAPYLAGALTEDHTLKQWRTVFWITFAIFNVTNIIYCLFGSAEEQRWNDPSQLKEQKLDTNYGSVNAQGKFAKKEIENSVV
ncbi:sialin-like isoform X2 [Diorhabda carinulata]|nr:sialin-like isoform X2 [Diorhabda carinulata]XP_057660212.1 sialin-like isoform X2 [Diorhabda carinulata]